MKFGIAASKKDPAGIGILSALRKTSFLPQVPVVLFDEEIIHAEGIDKRHEFKDVDFIIFASKHKSREQRKTLSLHSIGNWRDALYGGKSGKASMASAIVNKFLFKKINGELEISPLKGKYELTLECTHHGPLIDKPSCFVEVGGSEEEWNDLEAIEILSRAIAGLQGFDYELEKKDNKIAIGIGGPHYCPNFNKIQLNSNFAIGHVIPEYVFPFTEAMLCEAVEKTYEPVNMILLDWKGLGKSEGKQQIIDTLKKSGMNFERTNKIEK